MCLEQSRAEGWFSVLTLSYLWATTAGISSAELLELQRAQGQHDLPKPIPKSLALLKFSKGFPISDYKKRSYLWDEELRWYSDTCSRAGSIPLRPYGHTETSRSETRPKTPTSNTQTFQKRKTNQAAQWQKPHLPAMPQQAERSLGQTCPLSTWQSPSTSSHSQTGPASNV